MHAPIVMIKFIHKGKQAERKEEGKGEMDGKGELFHRK